MPARFSRTGTGGGGGGGTPAAVQWGPFYGVPPAVVTVSAAYPGAVLTADIPVSVTATLDQVSVAFDTVPVAVAASLDAIVAGHSTIPVTVATDMPAVALVADVPVSVAAALSVIAATADIPVGVAVHGSVLGAPFFQSQTQASDGSAGGVTSLVVNKPAGVAVGDLLLMFAAGAITTGTPPTVTCTGFTEIRNDIRTTHRMTTLYRVADGTEGSTFTVTYSATSINPIVALHRINGVDQTTPIHVHSGNTGSAADFSITDVTTTVANCMVYEALYHDHLAVAQTHTPPAGHDERDDLEVGAAVKKALWTASRVFSATGSTGFATCDCTEVVATDGVCHRIAVAPGPQTIA